MSSFSVGELCRSTWPVVWLISAVWALGLVLWSVLPPMFSAPDEPQHVDLVLDGRPVGLMDWPAPEGNLVNRTVERAQVVFHHFDLETVAAAGVRTERRGGGYTAAEAIERSQRPSTTELAAADRVLGDRLNQMAQHPPLYYRLAGILLAGLPGWEDRGFDVVVGVLRLLSVLALAPLPLLTAATASVLGSRRSEVVVAALMPLTIPQLAHIGSVVTNDSLLIAASALVTLLACRVVAGDHSSHTGRWIGGTLLIALLVKGFALFLPLAVVAAYVAAWWRQPDVRRELYAAAAWGAGISALSLWWYLENLIRFGSLQPSVLPPARPLVQGGLSDFADVAWRIQTQTFWGRIGWAEIGLTATSATVASVVLIVLVVVGALRRRPLVLAVLLLPGLAVVTSTLVRSYATFGTDGMIRAVQGRYAYLSISGFCVVAAWGLARLLPDPIRPWAWVAPVAAATALHLEVWTVALRYFWTTQEGVPLREAVETMVVWSPWSGRTLLVVAVALGVSVLAALVALVRTSATRPDDVLVLPTTEGEEPGRAPDGAAREEEDARDQHDDVAAT